MKKKRQKSFKSRQQKKKLNNKKQQQKIQNESSTLTTLPVQTQPQSLSTAHSTLKYLNCYKFNVKLLHSFESTINVSVDLSWLMNANFTNQGLDDKSKFLHNIFTTVVNIVFNQYSFANINNKEQTSLINALPSSDSFYFFKNSSSLPDLSFKSLKCICTQSCTDMDSCCLSNEFIDLLSEKTLVKKSRPSYIIERDCHVFGGCVEEDANDEFFISSGAVYQSWPHVYEPGFRIKPLPQGLNNLLSNSDDQINYFEVDLDHQSYNEPCELPSYSLDNYGINLFHTEPEKSTKRRKNISTASSYFESDLTDSDSSDDDSDSYRAYKHRHAIGLTNFNAYNSQSSLSDLGQHYQRNNNLYYTDSSSCDEHLRKSISEKSNKLNQRLTTSCNYYDENCDVGEFGRTRNLFGRARFLSQTCYLSSRNLIF